MEIKPGKYNSQISRKETFLREEKRVNIDHCYEFKKEEQDIFLIAFNDMMLFTSLELSQEKFG